ncbi:MAG: flagellar hook assembly protein FlgD [Proteobacteria bacterium]|uniref:Basal-body rod modification protein FlgD n=1 Tax=Candidatus Avisuccinivibrio stercorigallinarum TaxID=2840704 RepID=A0A9D9DD24_9GAMM|nr:flagellar hook assembly protein FlgD [Candidatus Avisuccinivibrio stercorigallinarum]
MASVSFDYGTIGKTDQYIASEQAASQTTNKNYLDQEDFLQLLTTQLQCQDPTSPVDNNQMVSQMSQLSMVENLTSINTGLTDIISAVNSSSALTASSLVGRSVLVDSSQGYFDGQSPVLAQIDAGSGAQNIKITVKDSNGQIVAEYGADSGSSEMNFAFDGIQSTDEAGNAVYFPAGTYTIEATGEVGGVTQALPVKTYATVGSVTLGSTYSETILNLIGVGEVPLSKVGEISL